MELRKCTECGFVFTAESIYNYETAVNKFFHKTRQELLVTAQKERLPLLVDEIVHKTKLQSGKTLDFGCGIGMTSLCLQEKGFVTYGIDTCKMCLEKHKDLNIISTNSLDALNAAKNSFDLIVMKDVLEHVDEPMQLLQQLLSFLKPSGYFYVRVPNVYHYPFHWSIDTKSHINHFSPAKLITLLHQNNMKKIDFIKVYDISTRVGKLYNSFFWPVRHFVPMYHQISLLYQKN